MEAQNCTLLAYKGRIKWWKSLMATGSGRKDRTEFGQKGLFEKRERIRRTERKGRTNFLEKSREASWADWWRLQSGGEQEGEWSCGVGHVLVRESWDRREMGRARLDLGLAGRLAYIELNGDWFMMVTKCSHIAALKIFFTTSHTTYVQILRFILFLES